MKIVASEFVRSCQHPDQFPDDRLPEIAVVGRSNIGKSSLLNSLLHRRHLVKVSRTPGKTRAINFFRVETDDPEAQRFYVVDLPGYGYAKVAKSLRAQWQPMIERYLTGRPALRGVLLLVDARGIEAHDRTAFQWLCGIGRRPVLVATKMDKLSRSERGGSLGSIQETLEGTDAARLVPYSSLTHEGRDELWRVIRKMVTSDE